MGPRVRIVLVVLTLLVVAALAVPLALSLADSRTTALATERGQQLSALSDAAAVPDVPLQALVDRYHLVYGEGLLVVDSDGRTLASRGLSLSDPGVAAMVNHALVDTAPPRWGRILPWHRGPLLTASGIRNDGELIGAVTLAADTSRAAHDVADGWWWIGAGCLVVLVVAALAGLALTRWVLHPLTGLERAVANMAEGIAGPPADVVGPPELRHFTSAFNTMADAVRASLERQRRLVTDASHQLRNPLAAVRLRADSLEDYVADEGRPTYRSMSAELDRFENLLQQLLRLARAEQVSGSRQVGLSPEVAESTDLDDVIAQRLAFWRPVADRQHQRLESHWDRPGLAAQIARHDVEQLIDVALDNALRYAGPGATITVSAAEAGETMHLVVSDDGPGLPDEDLAMAATRFWRGHDDAAGTGLGLAIAGEITSGHGGTIAVLRSPEGGVLVRYRLPGANGSTC
ncbi:MAG: HAMP domain-containing sensor histidine kinase [Mycobacterium sp.]